MKTPIALNLCVAAVVLGQGVTPSIAGQVSNGDQIVGVGTNTTIQATITAAVATGGRVIIPAGNYAESNIAIPATPKGLQILGAGPFGTVITAAAVNQPIFKCPSSGVADHVLISGLAVRANAAGDSSGPAVDLSGCRHGTFDTIMYLSNKTAGSTNWASFFHLAAAPALCYGNRIVHPIVDTQTGPTAVFLFDNGGTSNASHNANDNYIVNMWINANTGITTVIDARRSALTSIQGGLVENNMRPGAVVLIPGTNTTMRDVWLENNAPNSVAGMTGPDGSSNAVKIENNYISTAQTFTIQPGSDQWQITGNFPDFNLTVTDKSGAGTVNNVQTGRLSRGNGADVEWHFKNTAADGTDWALDSATGAGAAAIHGSLHIRDETHGMSAVAFVPGTGDLALFGKIRDGGLLATMGFTFTSGSGTGNYTGTNTSYANVDTKNLCTVVTVPSGWKLSVVASGVIESVTAAVQQSFALSDVGITCGGAGHAPLIGSERAITPPAAGTFNVALATQAVINGDGNAHAISLQAKTSNAADAWGIQNTSSSAAPSMTLTLVPSN